MSIIKWHNQINYDLPKKEKLLSLIKLFEYLPKQGTDEWKKQRFGGNTEPPTIGGSEISTLINKNKYRTLEDLYKSKLGLDNFQGNNFTRWGNFCEEIIQNYCDEILNTVTHEFGAIPGLDLDGKTIQSYSPDGVNIISIDVFDKLCKKWHEKYNNDKKYDLSLYLHESHINDQILINLMEYKCPAIRIPDGYVPECYLSQPLIGACTIPIIDSCIFIDAVLRRCSISQLKFDGKYLNDNDIHKYSKVNDIPCALTFVGIYDDSKEGIFSLDFADDIQKNMAYYLLQNDINDFNDVPMTQLLKKVIDDRFHPGYKAYYIKKSLNTVNYMDDFMTNLYNFIKYCEDNKFEFIGIIPMKIFKVEMVPIKKDIKFLENIKDDIYENVKKIYELKKEGNITEKKIKEKISDNNIDINIVSEEELNSLLV